MVRYVAKNIATGTTAVMRTIRPETGRGTPTATSTCASGAGSRQPWNVPSAGRFRRWCISGAWNAKNGLIVDEFETAAEQEPGDG